MNSISIIGLGKLGVPLAVCYAHAGFTVIGADVDPDKVEAINAGISPVGEPEVQEILSQVVPDRLTATTDIQAAVRDTDFTIIIVNTPAEAGNAYSLKYVFQACESVGRALRDKSGYHLVVLASTVMPGATGGIIRDALERISSKRCGPDFGLCHCPEFLAIGSAVENILRPDFCLIGESDPTAGDYMRRILNQLLGDRVPPIVRTSLVNAELAKIALNTALVTKISFANYWAMLCNRIPGADVDEVMSVVGLDSRIGPKFLIGSVSYGGPCFPRDVLAWTQISNMLALPLDLPLAVGEANQRGAAYLSRLIGEQEPVGILGLAYKPGVAVAIDSLGVALAERLVKANVVVYVYDPQAISDAYYQFEYEPYCRDLKRCIEQSECLVICTPWPEFHDIPLDWLQGKRVIDCWRLWDELPGVEYVAIGRG